VLQGAPELSFLGRILGVGVLGPLLSAIFNACRAWDSQCACVCEGGGG